MRDSGGRIPLRPGAELCPRNWHVEKKRLKGHLRDQRVSLEAASPCTTWVVGLVAGRVEWLAGALRWVSWAVEETGAFRCTNMMGQEIWSILVYYGTWHKVWSCEGFIAGKRSTRHLRWSLWCWPWNSFWTIGPIHLGELYPPNNKTTRNYAQRLSHGYHPNTTPTCSDVISVQIAELWQLIQINVPYPLVFSH